MEKQKAITLIKVLTLEEATEILENQSKMALEVGSYPQNYKRWPGKKLVVNYGSYFELVPDNEFWQRVMREQRASLKPDNEFCRGLM